MSLLVLRWGSGIPLVRQFPKATCHDKFIGRAAVQILGSFMCQCRCKKSAVTMQNSCRAEGKRNIKGEDMMAVAASTAGGSNSTSQKHAAWLRGLADGGFRRKEMTETEKSLRWDSRDSRILQTAGRRHFSAWPSLRWCLLPLFTVVKAA